LTVESLKIRDIVLHIQFPRGPTLLSRVVFHQLPWLYISLTRLPPTTPKASRFPNSSHSPSPDSPPSLPPLQSPVHFPPLFRSATTGSLLVVIWRWRRASRLPVPKCRKWSPLQGSSSLTSQSLNGSLTLICSIRDVSAPLPLTELFARQRPTGGTLIPS